jgi:hypothetical protein
LPDIGLLLLPVTIISLFIAIASATKEPLGQQITTGVVHGQALPSRADPAFCFKFCQELCSRILVAVQQFSNLTDEHANFAVVPTIAEVTARDRIRCDISY